ncbi:hypothetical protein [Telluribacter humicola]|uniref:hypothetical protein n=1 Tax=Telluribacter humicola TaxID=1720261 RepID=UPI001A976F96|nr:hypothetical protein [Telluribacter humicola]
MDEFEDIEELDEELEAFLSEWTEQLARLNQSLLERLYGYVDLMDVAAPLMNNLMLLTSIRTEIPVILAASGYATMVDGLMGKLDLSLEVLDRYFGRVFPDSVGESRRMMEEIRLAAQSVRSTLLGSGIEATYVTPIEQALQQHILTRSTKAEFRRSLKELLLKEGLSTRNISTYASDALYQFSRSYTLNVGETVGTQYYYYMGTRIKTTRNFCSSRLGRAWKQEEVESWANERWQGKIPGTTAQSIFWYVGGYNCRHRLLPITKSMYDYLIKQYLLHLN